MRLNKIELQEKDYPKALAIWERSVIATHDFLKEKDRIALKKEIPTYFSHVEAYLWFDGDDVIGFSGTNEANLEMLFLDPKYFKQGYGTEILQTLIQEHKVQYVDVNKDNPNAVSFYLKMDSNNMMNLQKMDRVGIIQSYILNCFTSSMPLIIQYGLFYQYWRQFL